MGSRRAVEAFWSFLTHIQTVDPGMKFSQQVRDSSLQIPNNPSALRNLWYSCMTIDGTLSPQNSTLSKKVMSHCCCHFHKWGTLDSKSNLLQKRLICPVHVLAWERWFWRQPLVLISDHSRSTRCCMVHEPSAFQDPTSQEFLLTTWPLLSTARLLWNKMFEKKKKKKKL